MVWRRLAAFGVVLATICLSFLPFQDKLALHTKGRLHSWGHFFIFAALAAVVLPGVQTRRLRLLFFLGLALLAFGIEVSQHFLYTSPLEITDVAVDLCGLVCGAVASTAWDARRQEV